MKRALGYLALGLGTYLVALLATFPAARAYALAHAYLPPQLAQLAVGPGGIEGTVWTGRVRDLRLDGLAFGELRWRLAPWSLFLGRLDGRLAGRLADGNLESGVDLARDGSVSLHELQGRLPADTLTRRLSGLPVAAAGTLNFGISELVLRGDRLQRLEGPVVWSGARLVAPVALDLGALKVDFHTGDDGRIGGRLEDGGGPLALAGSVSLEADGRYRVDARLGTRPGASKGLRQALARLGPADAHGRVRLRFQGRL